MDAPVASRPPVKRVVEPLLSGRVRLRLLDQADLPLTLAWRNQEQIRRWFFSSNIISAEQHRAWYDQYRDRDDDFVFVIEERETLNRPVGQVSLYHIDWPAGTAEFGRLMIGDPEARHLGLAQVATNRLLDQAFGKWGLQDIYLECYRDNIPALRVYAACGFICDAAVGDVVRLRKRANTCE